MRILVIGSGGREHALAWKLSQSPAVERVYGTPGNPGISQCGECIPAADGSPQALLAAAERVKADLTVVGPELPLVAGVVSGIRHAGSDDKRRRCRACGQPIRRLGQTEGNGPV